MGPRRGRRRPGDGSGQLVEEDIEGGDTAVPRDDEIGPRVRWRLARPARRPSEPAAIAGHLRIGDRLISKVGMSGPDRSGDAINLIAPPADAGLGVVERRILVEELVDGGAP